MIASRSLRLDVRIGGTLTLAGLVVLVISGLIVRNGRVGSAERSVFNAVNRLPDWLYRPLWVFQQFGNLVVALLVVLVVAALLRRADLAAAAVVAVVAKLLLERVVKSVVERSRPGTTVADAILRGEVSPGGLSFVSGHATITVAMALALTAVVPRRWCAVVWLVVFFNGFTRVYVGAHNPLDVVGGAGLGLVIGGPLYAWLAADVVQSS
ncbi:MAG TPA: phosphatase PAP2 family protein [Acidimicrobiales bacterium]|nr:phosphatase PAP2 family protein [Acidimicrobiales bacterium]